MRKIVHISTRLINGGAEENTILTCNHQAEQGHAVTLVYGADYRQRMLDWLDVKVHRIQLPNLVRQVSPLRDLAAMWQIGRLLRQIRPDVVHTHQSKAGIIGRLACFAVRSTKVVHGVHILPFVGVPIGARIIYLLLEKLATLRTDTFINVSPRLRDLCLGHRIGTPDKHFVVPSGMDIDGFHKAIPAPDIAALRSKADRRTIIAVYLAVFEPRKRHRELLQSLAPVLRRHENILLMLAGDGHQRPAIEEMVDSMNLGGQVHFLGFREDPQAVIAASDFCVFASAKEGLPRAIIQYVAVGKAIVAMRLPGIELVLHQGRNGYIIETDDFSGFAERFEEVAGDASRREAMARHNETIDLAEWKAEEMVRRIDVIYG